MNYRSCWHSHQVFRREGNEDISLQQVNPYQESFFALILYKFTGQS